MKAYIKANSSGGSYSVAAMTFRNVTLYPTKNVRNLPNKQYFPCFWNKADL